MALFWRIWAALTLVNLAVVTIFVALATLQFGNVNSALVGERLVVLADHTAAPFKAAARIGLPLSSVRNADALLERARQTDDAILAIHVFDLAGKIVHSTVTPPPTIIPAEALFARTAADGSPWHRETTDGFLSSIDIVSRDGSTVGGILIVYPGGGNLTRIRAMAAELGLTAIGVLVIAGVLSALLLRVGLRGQIESFEAIDSSIRKFERSAWRSAAGRPPDVAESGADELRGLLDVAETRYRTIGRALGPNQEGPP